MGGFATGDRVASNGKHAQVVSVPGNLCAKIPDAVSDDEAAFTVIGSIALQGIRLANPTLGETVVVTGLGLIGLIAVQLLKANGCRVIGIDIDPVKLGLAKQFGAEIIDVSSGQSPVEAAMSLSRGRGVDAVIITASSQSNDLVHQAALMSRKRGRIILVGVVGLELSRPDFYEKELSFQVSCSYGPGRYDASYEERGNDYPVGFVRWTEQRNFEAVLDMMAAGRLNVKPLISHRFDLDKANEAYQLITSIEPSLGILFDYPAIAESADTVLRVNQVNLTGSSNAVSRSTQRASVGFVGSGSYAVSVLIPAFQKTGAHLLAIASRAGVSSVYAGKKFGFEKAATSADLVINDANINTVVVATQHDSHADYIEQGLLAKKHVYVEKPLCLTMVQLNQISALYTGIDVSSRPNLMVGFNRRFAPHIQKIKSLLGGISTPKSFVMTINAGRIDSSHWTQDGQVGGGRIIGEACHFIDLMRYLAGSPITEHSVQAMGGSDALTSSDSVMIGLKFADGSIASIQYLANGSKSFPKERLDVFCGGKILSLDNFRKLQGYGWPGFKSLNLFRQDKGQQACVKAFIDSIENGKPSPIPFEEIEEVSRVTIEIAQEAR
jgi:predicted dehydrogenase